MRYEKRKETGRQETRQAIEKNRNENFPGAKKRRQNKAAESLTLGGMRVENGIKSRGGGKGEKEGIFTMIS